MFRFTVCTAVAILHLGGLSSAKVESEFGGVHIKVTSPAANRFYQTKGLRPGVEVSIHEQGQLAENIRQRPEDYELCIDFSAPHNLVSCKGLLSPTNLASADLSSYHEGGHTFRAFLRPRPGADSLGLSLLTEEELAGASVEVFAPVALFFLPTLLLSTLFFLPTRIAPNLGTHNLTAACHCAK